MTRALILFGLPTYSFSKLERHDVVGVRFAGQKVLLLKRIVAFEGEWVEFIEGKSLYRRSSA